MHTCEFDPVRNRMQAALSAPLNPGKTGLVSVMARPGCYAMRLSKRQWAQISPNGWLNLRVELDAQPTELFIQPD